VQTAGLLHGAAVDGRLSPLSGHQPEDSPCKRVTGGGPFRVNRDCAHRSCPPVDVRFPPKATEALLCSEMSRWANRKHLRKERGHLRWRHPGC